MSSFAFCCMICTDKMVQGQPLDIGSKRRILIEERKQRLYLYQIRNINGDFLSGKPVVE